LLVGAGVANAQTIVVKNAPPAATVEIALNGATIGTGKVNDKGEGRVVADAFAKKDTRETSAQLYVDACPDLQRFGFVERSLLPPPAAVGCQRHEVGGFFVLRPTTTLVVDVGGTYPVALISQGRVPRQWTSSNAPLSGIAQSWTTGLRLFGGVSFISFNNDFKVTCGEDVAPCRAVDFKPRYTFGAAYWVTEHYGGEVSYMKSGKTTTDGSGQSFRFNSVLEADIISITANAGTSGDKRGRLYARGGLNYHQAVLTNTQTNDDREITVDGVTQVIKGGTEVFKVRTGGWGWIAGGGIEYWWKPQLGLYGDFGLASLKGHDLDGGEAKADDLGTFLVGGVRIRIGRFFR
jgi:hypothetical protein